MKVAICGKQPTPLWLEVKGRRLELLKCTALSEGTPGPEGQSSAEGARLYGWWCSELRKWADGNGIQISGAKVLVERCWGLGSGDETH